MQDQTGKVIVTYGRSLIALMIAQSLGARGIEVIGCDDVSMTVLTFSQFVSKNYIYTSPDDNEEKFIEDLITIARDNKPEDGSPYVLMPAFRDAKIIAKHKERFEGIITLSCPEFEAIDKVDHKDAFAKTTKELDVSTPKTWLPTDENDLDKAITEMEFPVFIKPPDDVGGRGISKITDSQALRPLLKIYKSATPATKFWSKVLPKALIIVFAAYLITATLLPAWSIITCKNSPLKPAQALSVKPLKVNALTKSHNS